MKITHVAVAIAASQIILLAQPPGGSGDGVWRRNAYFGEIQTFDACLGHQPGSGQYHNHVQPVCLRAQLGDNLDVVRVTRTGTVYREKTTGLKHSPIIGWALDGYPIYGPYGYTDPNNALSAIKRMTTGYQLRAITKRTSLPDWSLANHTGISQQLTANQYGPDVSINNPLGRYVEDFDWVSGAGDLDVYNGRFTKTPEFPAGTYAYFATIDANGLPAFPFLLSGQYYGTVSGGPAQTVTGAQDYFTNNTLAQPASATPLLSAWATNNSAQTARIVSGIDPAAGPVSTWPLNVPTGMRTSGGVSVATNGEIQRIRYSATAVYVNANGMPGGYTFGPWFSPDNGGVFMNFPSTQSFQYQFPLAPAAAANRTATGLGPVGLWVNGVALFNFLDGGSYSNAQAADIGGGGVAPSIIQVSAASGEGGPVSAGSLVSIYPQFNPTIATSTAQADSPAWPLTMGGATVTVTDASNVSRAAEISYASPSQINYRVPDQTSAGVASVRVSAGGSNVTGSINVVGAYPSLFSVNTGRLAAGYVLNGSTLTNVYQVQSGNIVAQPVSAGSAANPSYLVIAGSGLGTLATATAKIGGVDAAVSYAGQPGIFKGLDQYNILIPPSLAKAGQVDVVVTAGGRVSNAVNITIQ